MIGKFTFLKNQKRRWQCNVYINKTDLGSHPTLEYLEHTALACSHNYELRITNYESPHDWCFSVLYQIFVRFAEMFAAEEASVGG